MTKGRGGRPPKWTPEVAFALGLAFGRGRCPIVAAREAGIGKATLHRWRRQGEAGDERFALLVAAMKAYHERWPFW